MTIKTVEERVEEFRALHIETQGKWRIERHTAIDWLKKTLTADRTALIEAGVEIVEKKLAYVLSQKGRYDDLFISGYRNAADDAITALQELNKGNV